MYCYSPSMTLTLINHEPMTHLYKLHEKNRRDVSVTHRQTEKTIIFHMFMTTCSVGFNTNG